MGGYGIGNLMEIPCEWDKYEVNSGNVGKVGKETT